MLWHAVRAVCVPPVEKVYVVLARDDAHFAAQDWSAFAGRLEPLYCGGAARHESVYNGLVATRAAWKADDFFLVHDAARPCLPAESLERLLVAGAADDAGAILAVPVPDTVKRAAGERIVATEDRAALWLAQTPQMFRAGLLLRALEGASADVTDEAMAVERLGLRPRLVPGSRENIKITWPEDLAIAEGILRRRAEAGSKGTT